MSEIDFIKAQDSIVKSIKKSSSSYQPQINDEHLPKVKSENVLRRNNATCNKITSGLLPFISNNNDNVQERTILDAQPLTPIYSRHSKRVTSSSSSRISKPLITNVDYEQYIYKYIKIVKKQKRNLIEQEIEKKNQYVKFKLIYKN